MTDCPYIYHLLVYRYRISRSGNIKVHAKPCVNHVFVTGNAKPGTRNAQHVTHNPQLATRNP
jgi:hypothetical protein